MKVASRYTPLGDAESRARADGMLAWLRSFSERRLSSQLMDARRSIQPQALLDLGNHGFMGVQVEEKYAGLALRNRDIARLLDQAAAIDLSLGTFLLVCLFPGVRPIAAFGSPVLKDAVLADLARGRTLAGYAQTEPGAGTHFNAMAAQAVSQPDGRWRVSGEKVWIGNAQWSNVLTVVAHDVDATGRRRGLTAFAVRTDQPGVVLGRELPSMGMRGVVQGEVSFRDVVVDRDHVVGEPKRGLEVGVDSMSWSRFAIASTCVGTLRHSVQLLERFGARREIATGRLVDHPVTRVALGLATVRVAACEALLEAIASALDAGREVDAELFAIAKVAGSEFAWDSCDRLMQGLGSRGYDEANGVPQIVRDARVTRIFEGASEPLFAFVGAAALVPTSDLHRALREELGASAVADALAEAVTRMRSRKLADDALSRDWQCALAGHAAMWAVLVAALGARSGGALRERALAWARAEFAAACANAAGGVREEAFLPAAAQLDEAIASVLAPIGDVEQQLPTERWELDPLLRR
ncbi:MAG: acyl-CoA dehydrogenase family protein [Myxococcota bacterium]